MPILFSRVSADEDGVVVVIVGDVEDEADDVTYLVCVCDGSPAGKYANNTFANIPESFKLMKFLFNFKNGKLHCERGVRCARPRCERAHNANGVLAFKTMHARLA